MNFSNNCFDKRVRWEVKWLSLLWSHRAFYPAACESVSESPSGSSQLQTSAIRYYLCSHECYNVNGTTKKEVLNLYPKWCFHSRSGVLHRKHSAAQWFKNYNIRENLCTHFSSPNWHLHSDTLAGTSSIERRHLLHVIAPGKREQWESVAERNAGTHGVLTDRHDDWGWWVPLAWVMGKDDEWILRPPCAYPQVWKIVVFWFFFLSSRNCRTVSLSFELLANDGYSFASRSVLSKYIIIDLMKKVHPILIKPI